MSVTINGTTGLDGGVGQTTPAFNNSNPIFTHWRLNNVQDRHQ